MQSKKIIGVVSFYKISINMIRIILGIIILYSHLDLHKAIRIIGEHDLLNRNFILDFLSRSVGITPIILNFILAIILIVFSILEIIFILSMLFRHRWGAVGLFITCIIWTLTEFLFVSKFLITSKLTAILINFVILYLLYNIIRTHDHYFKD